MALIELTEEEASFILMITAIYADAAKRLEMDNDSFYEIRYNIRKKLTSNMLDDSHIVEKLTKRYPYTHAYDFIREILSPLSLKLSRSDAS